MTEDEENTALAALLKVAGGHYDSRECFHLSRAQVIALVRGLLSARPGLTPAELRELAGRAGVPASVLIRVGKGGPAPAPLRQKATTWSGRTRLAERHGT